MPYPAKTRLTIAVTMYNLNWISRILGSRCPQDSYFMPSVLYQYSKAHPCLSQWGRYLSPGTPILAFGVERIGNFAHPTLADLNDQRRNYEPTCERW